MRNITFAIYKGIEYSAGIKKDGRIVLRSEDDASKKEGVVEKEIGNNMFKKMKLRKYMIKKNMLFMKDISL